MKVIIKERNEEFHRILDYNGQVLTSFEVFELLKQFIEHPTKPGYKRKDIEYFLKLNDYE